ncbi:MAG TPA: glycosyltransferase family 39 protein [Ktedonobacteraceae bacterium]|nr:glycosyltransferase family 39 protein [Ktedonobacteraceae bacterium]
MSEIKNRKSENLANVTLFRTANFFVHAFTPVVKTGTLPKASGNETILERIRWTSTEKERLMAAQTRLLPQVDTVTASQWHEISIPLGLEILAVAVVLGIILVVQVMNLFNYPAYGAAEGTLMANAWSLLHGQITPGAYTFSQPPIGWGQIAGWLLLTGGTSSFGNAINSGRVLMIVLAIASSLLLYLITSRMSGSRSAALLAMVIYSLSILSLVYRREVLFENIGVFWLLLSLCLITTGKSSLRTFVFAAVALGIAILSDEVFLCFLPVMLYAVWLYATPFQRQYSLLTFLYIVLVIVAIYVLYVWFSGQLFPPGLIPFVNGSQESLIGGILQIWQVPVVAGQFAENWNAWLKDAWLFLAAGIVAMALNILGGVVNRFQLLAALLAATYCVVLLFSRTVYPFSIVPLLPFLALNIAVALNTPVRWVTKKIGFDLARALLWFLLIGALIPASIQLAQPVLAQNDAVPQQQSLLWIRNNAPHNAVIITPSYLYSDLRDQGGASNSAAFPNTYIYTDVVSDSLITNVQLKQNWQNINFLVVDATMLNDIRDSGQYELLDEAIHHGTLRTSFGNAQDGTLIQIYQVITT